MTVSTWKALPCAATAVCLLLACGCQGDQPTTYPASGTVLLDGQPLSLGQVVFTPSSGMVAIGDIQPDGTFALKTQQEFDGAVAGRHKVSVTARQITEANREAAPGLPQYGPSLIPARYNDADTSNLSFEVMAGQPNHFEILLESNADGSS